MIINNQKIDPLAIDHRFAAIIKRNAELAADPELQKERQERAKEDRARQISNLISCAHLPERHTRQHKSVTGSDWQECFNKLEPKLGTGFVLALLGTRGTGKTQMAVNLAISNAQKLMTTEFVLAMDIFLRIKATFRRDSEENESEAVQSLCKPSLLIIDEIQERAETPFEDRVLTHILNKRYNYERDTILIGNLKPDDFVAMMGSSVSSRLNETGGMIECKWKSYRE